MRHELLRRGDEQARKGTSQKDAMTIDERPEALAQSVERLSPVQRGSEKRIGNLAAVPGASDGQTERRCVEIGCRFAETHDFINRLAHIAEAHEQGLDNLENQ